MAEVKKYTANIDRNSLETKAGKAFGTWVSACVKHSDLELINAPKIESKKSEAEKAQADFSAKKN